jgi:hypothetical protein
MINAVLNFTNFWDGRANNTFNGSSPFGPEDPNAGVYVVQRNGALVFQKIALPNASLASQAVGPPPSPFEMSFGNPDANNARSFTEIGKKLFDRHHAITPLGEHLVDRNDSVLGPVSAFPNRGLIVNYRQLIQAAFARQFWDFGDGYLHLTQTEVAPVIVTTQPVVYTDYDVIAPGNGQRVLGPDDYSLMEVNFSLFFGLSVMLYESTLIADQTPFDAWMETGKLNGAFDADALAGLNLFAGDGHCISCHGGPELTNASVRNAERGKNVIEPMQMAQGTALYDTGFYKHRHRAHDR